MCCCCARLKTRVLVGIVCNVFQPNPGSLEKRVSGNISAKRLRCFFHVSYSEWDKSVFSFIRNRCMWRCFYYVGLWQFGNEMSCEWCYKVYAFTFENNTKPSPKPYIQKYTNTCCFSILVWLASPISWQFVRILRSD